MAAGALPTPLERALRHVAAMSAGQALDAQVPVTLNFHPDRLARGRPILDQLATDGCYLSQFVTGTSNGGLTAYPGGDRWRWESRIFGAAYDEAPGRDRPVYGALNFRGKPAGGAQRFGLHTSGWSPGSSRAPRSAIRTAFSSLPISASPRPWRSSSWLPRAGVCRPGCRDRRRRSARSPIIGEAERTGRYAPQDLKKVWHYLARFGAPEMLAMD